MSEETQSESGGFTAPQPKVRNWEKPPASHEVKNRLKEGIMELYYDACNQLDRLAREGIPMPNELKITTTIDLTEHGRLRKNQRNESISVGKDLTESTNQT